MRRAGPTVVAVSLLVGGCGGALDAAGDQSRSIVDLWWLMFWLGLIPVVIVVAVLALVARRKPPGRQLTERRIVIFGGVVLSALLLVPVVAVTAIVERNRAAGDGGSLEIEVVANQFWWDLYYPHPATAGSVRAANEIHIPTGEQVTLRVTSNDVIHSFWVPELQGKIDLIPGRVNEITLHAAEPGVFHGRCAEFCGLGHTLMRLIVVASPPDEFDQWLQQQSEPADLDLSGDTRQLFADGCAPCHTVRGLFDSPSFQGSFGPDLTHLASRRMIGANILPNTTEALARWIVDPHGVKPGNRMPAVGLDPEELNVILELLNDLE